jgi:hypothetical protein
MLRLRSYLFCISIQQQQAFLGGRANRKAEGSVKDRLDHLVSSATCVTNAWGRFATASVPTGSTQSSGEGPAENAEGNDMSDSEDRNSDSDGNEERGWAEEEGLEDETSECDSEVDFDLRLAGDDALYASMLRPKKRCRKAPRHAKDTRANVPSMAGASRRRIILALRVLAVCACERRRFFVAGAALRGVRWNSHSKL